MFPVHIYEEGKELPKEGTYFLVAGNGLWVHKEMPAYNGFVKVNNISCLVDLNVADYLKYKLPKLPVILTWKIQRFFKEVVDKYNAESCVILFYNFEKNCWKVHVPDQKVGHSSVQYVREGATSLPHMDGYLSVGTIHSHCDFGAFHSGTDSADENTFDGFHATFGHNNRCDFSISASFVINGTRFKLNPLDCLEGINKNDKDSFYYFAENHEIEWAEELTSWMKLVSPITHFSSLYDQFFHWTNKPTCVGKKVFWAEDMNNQNLRNALGEGPFEVLGVENGKFVISTSFGLQKLSEKLFQKIDQDI